jgi:hypothetical protein
MLADGDGNESHPGELATGEFPMNPGIGDSPVDMR